MSTASVHARAHPAPAGLQSARRMQPAPLVPTLEGQPAGAETASSVSRVMDMMGGPKVLKAAPLSRAEVHDLIQSGLPTRSVNALVSGAVLLSSEQMLDAIGISLRTYQRFKGARDGSLSSEQSDRAWRVSE